MRILFCGDTFPAAPVLLQKRLPSGAHDEVRIWSGGEPRSILDGVDVVIPLMGRVDTAVMDAGCFKLIQQWGAGLDGVDLEAARARNIWVASVPASGSNAESVAEHAILLMLSLLRNFPLAQLNVRSGILGAPLGRTLAGCTVCLYGLGAIALPLAQRLRPFGVRLLGITRDPNAPKVADYGLDRCYSTHDRDECLAQTAILVPCVRLTNETQDIIGAHELACLPHGAYLVNVARGGLVNYDALYRALSDGHLAGAGLDVYWKEPISTDDPLLALANVIATPHVAGITERSYDEIADAVVENIQRLRRGEPPLNRAV
jgi:phosphoglycerate dehydrogenase-like enzyme